MDKVTENRILGEVHDDITPIVEEYVELNSKGFACCPLHGERTASFHIYRGNRFKCFGCGAEGDGIEFIQKIEGCDYVSALNIAASIYGIIVDDSVTKKQQKRQVKRVAVPEKQPVNVPKCYDESEVMKTITYSDNLAKGLAKRIGWDEVKKLWDMYHIGSLSTGETIFWQCDKNGIFRRKKIMNYNDDLHKCGGIYYGDGDKYRERCLFGEHLLPMFPDAAVGLLESEKSSALGAVNQSKLLWLATASKGNLQPQNCKALEGRRVYLFPDADGVEEWTEKAKELREFCFSVEVVDWWRAFPKLNYKGSKADIADGWLEKMPVRDVVHEVNLSTVNHAVLPLQKGVEAIKVVESAVLMGDDEIGYDDGVLRMTNKEIDDYLHNNF